MEDIETPERLVVVEVLSLAGIIATLSVPGLLIVGVVVALVFFGFSVGVMFILVLLLIFELWLWERLWSRKGSVLYVVQGTPEALSWGPLGVEHSVRFADIKAMECYCIEGADSLKITLHRGDTVSIKGVPFNRFREVCRFARRHYKGPMKYLGEPIFVPYDL